MRRCLLVAIMILAGVGLAARTVDGAGSADRTRAAYAHFARYLETVGAGDLEGAAAFWRPEDVAAARRLGITHPGARRLKVDADSPIWQVQHTLLDSALADYKFGPPVDLKAGPLAGNVVLLFRAYRGARRLDRQYLLQPDGQGGMLLASRPRWVAEQGPGTPGRWVTVFERRPDRPWELPPHLLANLDAAVDGMLDRLAVPAARRELLAAQKLHYLLAAPAVVEYLAGAPTVGVANLQVDMVITHHPYHVHELAHLVVNFWLEEPPLHALPLLQEGLATHLGGRWGRSPRVLARVGRHALRTGLVSLDDLLARQAFHARSADLTYAPAGVFAGFLLDTHGAGATRAAYLALSGDLEEVAGWSAAAVRARLAAALGTSWEELAARFATSLQADRDPVAGIVPAPPPVLWPDRPHPFSVQLRVLEAGTRTAAYYRDTTGALHVSVVSADGPMDAALLAGGEAGAGGGEAGGEAGAGGAAATGVGAAPGLFAEHFPARPYRGETHALILDRHEARLYDLRTETLVALHSEGFWATGDTDAPYANADGRRVAIRLAADLDLPAEGWVLVDRTP